MANFVYTMTLASGNSKLEGTPIYGFAPLEPDPAAPHYKAQSALDVQNIVLQASGTPGLTLAVPSAEVYKYFFPKTLDLPTDCGRLHSFSVEEKTVAGMIARAPQEP